NASSGARSERSTGRALCGTTGKRAVLRAPPASGAARLPAPCEPPRARAQARTPGTLSRERLPERVVELVLVGDLTHLVRHDLPVPVDEERLRQTGDPPRLPQLRGTVVRDQVRESVFGHELLRVAVEVPHVDADEH